MIRLTERNPNTPGETKPRWFNPAHIRSLAPTDPGSTMAEKLSDAAGHTKSQTVVVVGGDKPETVWVDETPEEIIAAIDQADANTITARGKAMADVIQEAYDQFREREDERWRNRPVPGRGQPAFEFDTEGPAGGVAAAAPIGDEPAVTDPSDRPPGKHERNHGSPIEEPARGAE